MKASEAKRIADEYLAHEIAKYSKKHFEEFLIPQITNRAIAGYKDLWFTEKDFVGAGWETAIHPSDRRKAINELLVAEGYRITTDEGDGATHYRVFW